MGEYIEIFDFKKVFLEYFLGSTELFIFFLIISLSALCGYFNMSNRNFGIILVVSSLIFAGYLGQGIYFLVLVILGFVLFKTIAKIFN